MKVIGCICVIIVIILIIVIAVATGCNGNEVRDKLNAENGSIAKGFKRLVKTPRPDYEAKVEALGLTYHDEPSLEWSNCEQQAYWDERGAIQIGKE